MGHLPFHPSHLFQPSYITFAAVEFCPEERSNELRGELRANHVGPEAEDVHVVMLDSLARRVGIVTDGGADSRELGGRDRGAHARTAHEDGSLCLAGANRVA